MLGSFLTIFLIMEIGGKCLVCHSEIRRDFKECIHAKEGIGCASCHGGDEKTLNEKRAHGSKFIGVPKRKEIPKFCSRCHSDPSLMKPYGLPIDQYALYLTSGHGRRFSRGDTTVAVCTDCHPAHQILKKNDPRSTVNKRNIVSTCEKCHADSELMEKYGIDPSIPEKYRKGVHGKALIEDGNLRSPDCSNCHGSHGAAPSGYGDINKVCGLCHPGEREFFLKGNHKVVLDRAGLPECISCHNSHLIVSMTPQEGISTMCRKCHEEGTSPIKFAMKLLTLFQAADDAIKEAENAIEEAKRLDVDVEDFNYRLEKSKLYLTEAIPVLHTFELELVETELRKARSEAEDIVAEVHQHKVQRRGRIFVLIAIWFYILLTISITYRFRRKRKEGEARQD